MENFATSHRKAVKEGELLLISWGGNVALGNNVRYVDLMRES
jgi:hypothetical protein